MIVVYVKAIQRMENSKLSHTIVYQLSLGSGSLNLIGLFYNHNYHDLIYLRKEITSIKYFPINTMSLMHRWQGIL
jgi:hypothetical protein